MPLPTLSPAEVAARLADPADEMVLIDCREPEERALAAIEGALAIPMGDIPSELPMLDPEKDTVVFCHHGIRSYQVALFLKNQDFDAVWNMDGGIEAWSLQVDPSIPRY